MPSNARWTARLRPPQASIPLVKLTSKGVHDPERCARCPEQQGQDGERPHISFSNRRAQGY
jgi:hypothetical protein